VGEEAFLPVIVLQSDILMWLKAYSLGQVRDQS